MKVLLILTLTIFLTACKNEEQVVKECSFELIKVTAIRGGPLNSDKDLDELYRKRFFSKCFEAKGYEASEKMLAHIYD